MIPEHAVLHRAPASAGDLIPPLGERPSRLPGAGIDIEDNEPRSGRSEVNIESRSRAKRDRRNPSAHEVVGGTVVRRNRKIGWERVHVDVISRHVGYGWASLARTQGVR